MKVAAIAAVAALATLVLAASGSAAPPTTLTLPPQAAEAASAATATVEIGPVRQISQAAAYALGNQPGAVVERADQTPFAARRLSAASAAYCWFAAPKVTWGLWPYQQNVVQNTTWCAYYNSYIYYRSTNMTLNSNLSTLCSAHDPYQFRTSGGTYYWWVDVEGGGYFDCPTAIPWVTIHRNDYAIWEYTAVGNVRFLTSD
jgi:hypothetical protein